MTKTSEQKNVLINLSKIHSLHISGDILSLLRELRENRDRVDSYAKVLNTKAKEIAEQKEAETQRIALEQMAKARKKQEDKPVQTETVIMPVDEDKNKQNASNDTIVSAQKFEAGSQEHNNDKQQSEARTERNQSEAHYDRKRTFDVSKQNNQGAWKKPDRNGYQKDFQKGFGQKNFAQKPYSKDGFSKRPAGSFNTGFKKRFDNNFAGKKPGQNSGFASTKANNFKDFVNTDFVIEKERNFGSKNKSHTKKFEDDEKQRLSQNKKQTQKRFFYDINSEDGEERMGTRKIAKPKKKQETFVAPSVESAVITTENVSVKMLSEKIGKPVPEIIKQLMILGVMATINSNIDFTTAELISGELGVKLEQKIEKTYEEKLLDVSKQDEDDENVMPKPPVVTVMGHVDHGKTSLLDAIRKTDVAGKEAGGITQRIGAYSITHDNQKITFIDTPGHAAFTSMRARGAKITNVAILVVAADDGVMPQTIEAINHIKAADVPMIVAINKMDIPEANPERIKTQLASNGILPEEWGGNTIIVPVSAKTGVGIDNLINMILLVADMQGLKANPNRMAVGTIIEATLDKNKGPVATVLVQNGTLRIGNSIMSGITIGKVRAMYDEYGNQVTEALPSTPVSVLGFYDVPNSGDQVYAVSEKLSKQIISERKTKLKEEKALTTSGVTLDDFMNKVNESKLKTLNLIIKADVQGSVEALKQTLTAIANEEVRVVCIHSGVGQITESDLVLAKASNSIIINFNLKVPQKSQNMADNLGIEIKSYQIIYEVVEDITNAITGMLSKKYEQVVAGHAEVRMVFKLSTSGLVAGCYVTDGKIIRGAMAKVSRNGEIIADVEIVALKIFKDDKAEVQHGFECGIKLKDMTNIKQGDIIECYENVEIKRQ